MAELLVLPTTSFEAVDLEPDHIVSTTRSRGGYLTEITVADPLWGGSLRTTPLTERQLRAWEAFVSDATERKLAFDFVHPSKRQPINYDPDVLPIVDPLALTDVSDLRNPEVSGLPVGLQLLRGDRVAFLQGDLVSHRMIRADTLVASTISQALPVTPRLPLGVFAVAAEVRLIDAPMRLRVVANSWTAPLVGGQPVRGSFEVFESIR